MANGVFDEWLQQQRRHETARRFGRNVHRNHEPVLEARAQQRDVVLEHLEFVGERHFLRIGGAHRCPKQRREVRELCIGRRDVLVHGGRDGVEGVEEEVRFEAKAQCTQVGLCQRALENGVAAISLASGEHEIDDREDGDDRDEVHEVGGALIDVARRPDGRVVLRVAERRAEGRAQVHEQPGVHEGDRHEGAADHEQRPFPRGGRHRQALQNPGEDAHRQHAHEGARDLVEDARSDVPRPFGQLERDDEGEPDGEEQRERDRGAPPHPAAVGFVGGGSRDAVGGHSLNMEDANCRRMPQRDHRDGAGTTGAAHGVAPLTTPRAGGADQSAKRRSTCRADTKGLLIHRFTTTYAIGCEE